MLCRLTSILTLLHSDTTLCVTVYINVPFGLMLSPSVWSVHAFLSPFPPHFIALQLQCSVALDWSCFLTTSYYNLGVCVCDLSFFLFQYLLVVLYVLWRSDSCVRLVLLWCRLFLPSIVNVIDWYVKKRQVFVVISIFTTKSPELVQRFDFSDADCSGEIRRYGDRYGVFDFDRAKSYSTSLQLINK